jgi:hypothetical protein
MGGEAEIALVRAPRFPTNGLLRQERHETEGKEEIYIHFIQSELQN